VIFQSLDTTPTIANPPLARESKNIAKYRSNLMVRGDNPKHLNKLDELVCDVATINLEDGISLEDKTKALELTKKFISNLQHSYSKIVIRVNELDNGGLEEIKELYFLKPDAFRIPKIRTIEELKAVEKVAPEIDIYATIETKEAYENLSLLLQSNIIKVAYLGVLDLLSDLNLPQNMILKNNKTIEYIMANFVIKCRTYGVVPVSFTYQDYKNIEEYKEWCELSKSMGFDGMGCISPTQVEIANKIFFYSKEEIEKALYIKNIFETQKAKGVTGFSDELYGFIDEPIYRDALVTLSKN